MMTEINDELMMPCAQCCRKHLSAAIAHYADVNWYIAEKLGGEYWRCLVARALINFAEAEQGYESHRPFAVGLLVRAEVACEDMGIRRDLRSFRLKVDSGEFPPVPHRPTTFDWYRAHLCEAEREFPDIRSAVEREPFYRDNMSKPELRQAEINYRLAQLKWLDENIFGTKPVEKGDNMACNTKKGCKGACKGGKSAKKAPVKKGK